MAATLPMPSLSEREEAGIFFLTDDALVQATGVRIAFSGRFGGVSEGEYASLNLGDHVGDDLCSVQENRRRLAYALGAKDSPLIVPNQVHGTALVDVSASDDAAVEAARQQAREGADGIVVSVSGVAALLCFADCVPVIVVSPSGRFAVAHAGWRGAVAHIASKAVEALAALDADGTSCTGEKPASELVREAASAYNVYIGPCIHAECFDCGPDVCARFEEAFGAEAVPQAGKVDLPRAVALDVEHAGVNARRVCDAGACTMCDPGHWFSYRASGGACGRHGAFAFRKEK